MKTLLTKIENSLTTDLFKEGKKEKLFVGRPFYIDYSKVNILTCDAWKYKAGGIPKGSFLLAFYDGEDGVNETLLLRAIGPSILPSDSDNVKSMVSYYKDNIEIAGRSGVKNSDSKLDQFTKFEFSCSGMECRVLGAFYSIVKNSKDGREYSVVEFGADVENFYSANNYKVYKASDSVLKEIVNQRDHETTAGSGNEFPIGSVRYSSSRRFQTSQSDVQVYISPSDFLGKRTALFGMTRTGKSNTVKKIIQATTEIGRKATNNLSTDRRNLRAIYDKMALDSFQVESLSNSESLLLNDVLKSINKDGSPRYKSGQIIFDVNGEYANANMQDDGTAIFEMYSSQVERYSVLEKKGFKVLKINFFNEIQSGFSLISSKLKDEKSDYVRSFLAIDLDRPEGYSKDIQERTSDEKKAAFSYDRKKALYLCCIYRAGFVPPPNRRTIKFNGCTKTINKLIPNIKPHEAIGYDEAIDWFERLYTLSGEDSGRAALDKYKKDKGVDFLDEDMRAMLVFLTRKSKPNSDNATLSGYRKLRQFVELHTHKADQAFDIEIGKSLRKGMIVIVDLSQGKPDIQQIYSERICKTLFDNSMDRFVSAFPNNFIQFYFEEAHNLFPKKSDSDLTDIYNRIAKEGAKLNLGMIYATQEVSSISSNILKNTQNWFIAHLNNDDELREIKKYYDFSDFVDSLTKFSAGNDKGFVRMKTHTNPFVVPVQIDRFSAK